MIDSVENPALRSTVLPDQRQLGGLIPFMRALGVAGPSVWIRESIALRKTIYPTETNLSWDYAYQIRSELDERLERAGIRIAAYLNQIFDPAENSPFPSRRK